MRIAVCAPQVPFERGGAEIFADDLVGELRARGHETDLVTVPYKWYPGERVLSQAFLWRLLDLSESDGRPIELVIEPQAAALAEACSWLRDHVDDARAWGQAGKEIARRVSWDETIARLLA